MSEAVILTSMSTLDTFARCRKKFDMQELRGWIPRTGSKAMHIGTGYHIAVAEGYKAVREFDVEYKKFRGDPDAWAEQEDHASAARSMAFVGAATTAPYRIKHDRDGVTLDLSKEDRELIEDMVAYFWQEMGAADLKTITEILAVEEPVYIQIGRYVIRNTIDLLARVVGEDGPIPFDHKTVGDVKMALNFLARDFQTRSYYSGVRGKYGKVPRFVHTFVNRDVPPGFGHRSELTPTGKTRNAKTLADMREPTRYVRRESTPLSDSQIDAFEGSLVKMLADIERSITENYFPPSPLKGNFPGCDGCPYAAPCAAEIDGREVGPANAEMLFIVRGSEEWQKLQDDKLAAGAV
jgi:hypothetical protein